MEEKNTKNPLINPSDHQSFQSSNKSFPSEISNANIRHIEEKQMNNLHQQQPQSNHLINNNNSLMGKVITFQIENTHHILETDIRIAIKGYPAIISNINIDSGQVIVPDWIDIKTLKDYFTYIQLSMDLNKETSNLQFNFKKLVQLVNYFENDSILNQMIQSNIIPNISIDNCINLINDSYQYCRQLTNEQLKRHWTTLLLQLRKFIIVHFAEMLQCNSKLKSLNKNLLRSIIECHLLDNIEDNIEDIHISQLLNVLYHLKDVNADSNIDNELINNDQLFDLIDKERKIIEHDLNQSNCKENYISYVIDLTDFLNQYVFNGYKGSTELKKVYNKQEIIFTITYNPEEDDVIIRLKINKCSNYYKLLSLSAIILIQNDKANDKRVIKIISSNGKNNQNRNSNGNGVVILKMNSFSKYIKCLSNNSHSNQSDGLSLSITIKINIIESFILQYFIDNFIRLHKCNSIIRIPGSIVTPLLIIALENSSISNENILSFIMLWHNSNIKDEDVINILEQINWEKIPLGKTFEFIIKFPQFLSRHSIEQNIMASLINKTNQKFYYSDNDNGSSSHSKEFSFKSGLRQESRTSSLQLNIITYFFVNLVECSKRIKFAQTLITLETLVNQLKNSAMVLSTAANNKSNNFACTSTSQFIKNKTRNINHLMPPLQIQPQTQTQSASILSQSVKINVCDIDKKIPVITENELCNNKESKHSDTKSDNNKKSTEYSNQLPNKSFEAFHSQRSGSLNSIFKTPPNKKVITYLSNNNQNTKINKVKQPIVDIFFHTNAVSKNIKDRTSSPLKGNKRSISKIHIKSYK